MIRPSIGSTENPSQGRIHALLPSPEMAFETAVSVHLARFPDRFYEAWISWLNSQD